MKTIRALWFLATLLPAALLLFATQDVAASWYTAGCQFPGQLSQPGDPQRPDCLSPTYRAYGVTQFIAGAVILAVAPLLAGLRLNPRASWTAVAMTLIITVAALLTWTTPLSGALLFAGIPLTLLAAAIALGHQLAAARCGTGYRGRRLAAPKR